MRAQRAAREDLCVQTTNYRSFSDRNEIAAYAAEQAEWWLRLADAERAARRAREQLAAPRLTDTSETPTAF